MELSKSIFLIIIFGLLLVKSADLIEDSFISLSKRFKLNTFLTGFIVLAFTSSLPEFSVAVNAVSDGVPALSVGNILGATIIILTLIIGLNAIKHNGLPFKGFYGPKEVVMSLMIIGAQVAALIDGKLTRIEGVLLVSLYFAFITYIIYKSKHDPVQAKRRRIVTHQNLYLLGTKAVVGVAGLVLSSEVIVNNALVLADIIRVPNILVGLFMLSFGTSLPEITLLLRSNTLEKTKLAAGNFIGSATFNTVVLGYIAFVSPFKLNSFVTIIPAIIILTVTLFMFAQMVLNDEELTAKEGYKLLLIFVLLLLFELAINPHI